MQFSFNFQVSPAPFKYANASLNRAAAFTVVLIEQTFTATFLSTFERNDKNWFQRISTIFQKPNVAIFVII